MTYEIDTIPLKAVRIDGGTQSRVELCQATISEYTESIRSAIEMPPITAFWDGSVYWLADGFHRFHAHRHAGAMEISANIHTGTMRDAILFSVGANANHGLRRTNEDKRRAVTTLLNDDEWATWSNEAVARACNVSPHTVASVKGAISANAEIAAIRTVERNGKTYEQDTAKIGKTKQAPESGGLDSSREIIEPVNGLESQAVEIASTVEVQTNDEGADELQDLRDKYADLAESFKETLDDNNMMARIFEADDQIAAAMLEVTRYKALAENAERSLAAKNSEFVARAKQVTYWQNQCKKAEKEVDRLKKELGK